MGKNTVLSPIKGRLTAFEKMLKNIFGPNREEDEDEQLRKLYSSPNIIRMAK
jgi:hypothetical protein